MSTRRMISALLRLPGSAQSPELLVALAGVCGAAGAWGCAGALAARLAGLPGAPPAWLHALVLAAPPCCSLPEVQSVTRHPLFCVK